MWQGAPHFHRTRTACDCFPDGNKGPAKSGEFENFQVWSAKIPSLSPKNSRIPETIRNHRQSDLRAPAQFCRETDRIGVFHGQITL
jgi:hypothetical protein